MLFHAKHAKTVKIYGLRTLRNFLCVLSLSQTLKAGPI